MIDFHNHLLPGVDDGAGDLTEARAAAQAMWNAGVRSLVVTPHLRGSITRHPEDLRLALERIDLAYAELARLLADEFPELKLDRGVELMLDTPQPEVEDPRLRLAGTASVLVEFPSLLVPPQSAQALYELKLRGWKPIVAHPERYHNMDDMETVEDWRTVGCSLQLNQGSVLGRYGERAQNLAWALLGAGSVDYLSSDYHARGRLRLDECRAIFQKAGGEEQYRLLTEENPARLLRDEDPLPVPPLKRSRSLLERLLGRG